MPAPMRSWSEFFDFSNFSAPPKSEQLIERLNINTIYYQTNYLIICLIGCLIISIRHYLFFVGLLVDCFIGYILFVNIPSSINQTINQSNIPRVYLLVGWLAVSIVQSLFLGGVYCLVIQSICLSINLIHAAIRQPSIKSKATNLWQSITQSIKQTGKNEDNMDPELGMGNNQSSNQSNNQSINPAIHADAAKFRSQFRSQMREKYLNRG